MQFAFTGSAEYWNIPNGFRYNYPASVVFGIYIVVCAMY